MTWDAAFEIFLNSNPPVGDLRAAFRAAWQARGVADAALFPGLTFPTSQLIRQNTVRCPTDNFVQTTVKCLLDGTVFPIAINWESHWVQPSFQPIAAEIHAIDALNNSR